MNVESVLNNSKADVHSFLVEMRQLYHETNAQNSLEEDIEFTITDVEENISVMISILGRAKAKHSSLNEGIFNRFFTKKNVNVKIRADLLAQFELIQSDYSHLKLKLSELSELDSEKLALESKIVKKLDYISDMTDSIKKIFDME